MKPQEGVLLNKITAFPTNQGLSSQQNRLPESISYLLNSGTGFHAGTLFAHSQPPDLAPGLPPEPALYLAPDFAPGP